MHKDKVLKLAKGFRGRAKNCVRIARQSVSRALQFAYRDRRQCKREFRSLWITRINAAARHHGVTYGNLTHGLKKENVALNTKVLSELAHQEPESFRALVEHVKAAQGVDSFVPGVEELRRRRAASP